MNHANREQLIAFENRIKALWEEGELRYLLHLCGGNEDQLIKIFSRMKEGDWIFSTHRSHYHALLAGISEQRVEKLIRQGDSMFIFAKEKNFLSSAILAGTCCIAAGVAWDIKEKGGKEHVWCFLGDGAEDEGHFYEAVLFASGHKLPCTFILEDNNRSVDTDKAERRGTHVPQWPEEYVQRYHYEPVYPHAGSGCKHHIIFKH